MLIVFLLVDKSHALENQGFQPIELPAKTYFATIAGLSTSVLMWLHRRRGNR